MMIIMMIMMMMIMIRIKIINDRKLRIIIGVQVIITTITMKTMRMARTIMRTIKAMRVTAKVRVRR